jgi:hypothetical protein
MATMNDLANIYIAAGLTPPARYVGSETPVTDADVQNTRDFVASQLGATAPTTVGAPPPGSDTINAGPVYGDLTYQQIYDQAFGYYKQGGYSDADAAYLASLPGHYDTANYSPDLPVEQRSSINLPLNYTHIQQALALRGFGGGAAGGGSTRDQLLALFGMYGLDPYTHFDGTPRDFDALVRDVEAGTRNLTEIDTTLRTHAIATGTWAPGTGGSLTGGGGTGPGVIAPGAVLYGVSLSDGTIEYHAVYEWEGLKLAYRIGDQTQLAGLFPNTATVFSAQFTVSQQAWDDLNPLLLGSIDERLGSSTPISVEMNNAIRTFGLEAMPDWLRNDAQAMQIAALGAMEGWSAGRVLEQVSQTAGFQQRFQAWDWALGQAGGDSTAAMSLYIQRESALRDALARYRGPSANLSYSYLAEVMQIGWTVEAIVPILAAEEQLRADPAVFNDINRLLMSSGLNPIGPVGAIALIASQNQTAEQAAATLAQVDLTELLGGNSPSMVFDLINDAMTLSALEDQGFVGLDLDFVRQLRNETGGVLSQASIDNFAQTAAINVLRFGPDIDLGRYGLEQEDVISAAAARPAPSGRTSAEINEIMARIMRERQAAAGGYDTYTGFVNQTGRLQLQGLGGL